MAVARLPTRQRGVVRTAAILAAASLEFAEKGYAGATMTEIAARSQTAIGSLYRFFPTKEVLAGVLLERYSERMGTALGTIARSAPALSFPSLADALVDLMLDTRADSDGAVALIDARGDGTALRGALREKMRTGLGEILMATGKVSLRNRDAAATVVLHLLKTVKPLAEEELAGHRGAVGQLRALLARYLADQCSVPHGAARARG